MRRRGGGGGCLFGLMQLWTLTFRAEVERNQNCFCRLVIWQLAEQLNSHGRPAEPPSPRRLQVLAGVLAVKGRRDRSASHEQRSRGRKLWETSTSGPLRWGREGRDTSVQQIGLHSLKPKHTHQRRRAHTHVISLHLKHAHTHTHTHRKRKVRQERWSDTSGCGVTPWIGLLPHPNALAAS